MVEEFISSRQPQSEADFFKGCLPGAPQDWIKWANAVRWAIARLGRVHPRYSRSDDYFDDLRKLPLWCNRGDIVHFDSIYVVMLIEKAIEIIIEDEEAERLPNLDSDENIPVRVFVRKIVELCARKAATTLERT